MLPRNYKLLAAATVTVVAVASGLGTNAYRRLQESTEEPGSSEFPRVVHPEAAVIVLH